MMEEKKGEEKREWEIDQGGDSDSAQSAERKN